MAVIEKVKGIVSPKMKFILIQTPVISSVEHNKKVSQNIFIVTLFQGPILAINKALTMFFASINS